MYAEKKLTVKQVRLPSRDLPWVKGRRILPIVLPTRLESPSPKARIYMAMDAGIGLNINMDMRAPSPRVIGPFTK